MVIKILLKILKNSKQHNVMVEVDGVRQLPNSSDEQLQQYELELEQANHTLKIFQHIGNQPMILGAVGSKTGKWWNRYREIAMSTLEMVIYPHRTGEIVVFPYMRVHNVRSEIVISQTILRYTSKNIKVIEDSNYIGWSVAQRLQYAVEQSFWRLLFALLMTGFLCFLDIYYFMHWTEMDGRAYKGELAMAILPFLCISVGHTVHLGYTLCHAFYLKAK